MLKIVLSFIIIQSIFIFTISFLQKYKLRKIIDRDKEVYAGYCISCHIMELWIFFHRLTKLIT